MAEIATVEPQPLVKDLINDEEFKALPFDEKVTRIQQVSKNDPQYRALSSASKEKLFQILIPRNGASAPSTDAPSTDAPSTDAPSTDAPSTDAEPAIPTPTTKPSVPTSEPSALSGVLDRGIGVVQETMKAAGKGVAKGLDLTASIPSTSAKLVGGAISLAGQAKDAVLGPSASGQAFQTLGEFMQHNAVVDAPLLTKPVETAVSNISKGNFMHPAQQSAFEESQGAYKLLEDVVSAATGVITPAGVTARVMPLLRNRVAIPALDVIKKAMTLAAAGKLSGDAVKELGGSPWLSMLTETAVGLASPKEWLDIFRALKAHPAVQKYFVSVQEKWLAAKAEAAHGGGTFEQNLVGDLTARTTGQQTQDAFLTQSQAPVVAARDATTLAKQDATAARDALHVLKTDAVGRLEATDDLAFIQTQDARQKLDAIQDQITQLRNSGATADQQQLATLTRQQRDLQNQLQQTLRGNRDATLAVTDEVAKTNKSSARLVSDQEDLLDTLAAANKKTLDTVHSTGEKNAATLAPAGAETPSGGRTIVQQAGEAAQSFYDAVAARIKTVLGPQYDKLFADHNVQGNTQELVTLVNKHRANIEPTSIPTAEVAGRNAPARFISDFDAKIEQLGASGADMTNMSLKDIHEFRSSLYDEIRHTPMNSQRRQPLQRMAQEVEAYVNKIGDKYPDVIQQYRDLNSAFRTEIHRLTGGPGRFAQISNPVTGELVHTPIEAAGHLFGPGPTIDRTTRTAAEHEQSFKTFLSDIADVHELARLDGDTATMAAAMGAKDNLFDVIKASFYSASMKDGVYTPKLAAKWLADHSAQLDASPELSKLFNYQKGQAAVIRDVEAKAQAARQLPETYLAALKEEAVRLEAEGKERVQQAARARTAADDAARDVVAQGAGDVSESRLTLAQEKLERSQQTTGDLTQAARDRQAELTQIQRDRTLARRDVTHDIVAGEEQVYTLDKRVAAAEEAEKKATDYYKDTFGHTNAAMAALDEDIAERVLGARPEDIVAQMNIMGGESKGSQVDRNRAFGNYFRRAGGDEHGKTEQSLLQAMWRQFLGEDELGRLNIANPNDAAAFIEKNKAILREYYPEYYSDINKVQGAYKQMGELNTVGSAIPGGNRSLFSHAGVPGFTSGLLHSVGILTWPQTVGLALGLQNTINLLHFRRVATMAHMYMTPADLAVVARQALNNHLPPNIRETAMFSVLVRSGIIAKEATEDKSE